MLQLTPACGAIGMIDAFAGDVRVIAEGMEGPARSGFMLKEGHVILTGTDAWALFAMSDGAGVVLRPNSELRFDMYRFAPAGDVTRNGCLLSLAKGAFRFVTGLIGRNSRSIVRIANETIQIGIRG